MKFIVQNFKIKKSILFLAFTCIFSHVYAQSELYRKKLYSQANILIEEYDLKDSLSNIKEGFYAKYYLNGNVKKTGLYKKNKRTGVWSFYNATGALTFKYNYTTELILTSEPDRLSKSFLEAAGIDTNFYAELETVPQFVGGEVELYDFLRANIRYPVFARESNIQGKVIVSFTVTKDGFIENPKVVRSLGFGCDEEALRVINLMPKWVPGRKQIEVSHTYYLPITFKLVD